MTATTTDNSLQVKGEVRELVGTAVESLPDEVKRIVEKLNSGNIGVVSGALGDMENCEGIVEQIIEPPEGGRLSKFFGCSFLFKGYPLKEIVEGIGFSKSLISMLPRKLLARSRYWKTAIVIRYLLGRKYFWHDLHIIFFSIYTNIVQKAGLPPNKYNKPSRVLRETVNRALGECMDDENNNNYKISLLHGDIHVINRKREIWETIALVWEFIYLFIEYDNAYRFRVQDAFEAWKKGKLKGFGVVREVSKIFDILIEREDKMHGIRNKWIELKKVVIPILYLDSRLRQFTRLFLENLDIEEIKLDEHDWYFCLKRMSYQFRGIPLKERLAERKKIDQEKGHKYYRLIQVKDENGETKRGIQVLDMI